MRVALQPLREGLVQWLAAIRADGGEGGVTVPESLSQTRLRMRAGAVLVLCRVVDRLTSEEKELGTGEVVDLALAVEVRARVCARVRLWVHVGVGVRASLSMCPRASHPLSTTPLCLSPRPHPQGTIAETADAQQPPPSSLGSRHDVYAALMRRVEREFEVRPLPSLLPRSPPHWHRCRERPSAAQYMRAGGGSSSADHVKGRVRFVLQQAGRPRLHDCLLLPSADAPSDGQAQTA